MRNPSTAPIALLTDFGNLDPYVGIMKSVIAGIAPGVPMIDISHEVPPGDIQRAAFVLWQAWPYLPEGTVCLCVVDPGVGTRRKPVLYESEHMAVIAPDNGLLTYVLKEGTAVYELANPAFQLANPSHTFHGRDIFAPAAGHAALGVPGPEFGPRISQPARFPLPRLDFVPGGANGQTLHADRFGNVLTSLGRLSRTGQGLRLDPWIPLGDSRFLGESLQVIFRGEHLPLADTFAGIPTGKVGALIGSTGLLEIVANGESAKEILDISPGEPVELRRTDG